MNVFMYANQSEWSVAMYLSSPADFFRPTHQQDGIHHVQQRLADEDVGPQQVGGGGVAGDEH